MQSFSNWAVTEEHPLSERTWKTGVMAPALALAAGAAGANAQGGEMQALKLNVIERGDMVEIELVANSPITQQVQYDVELIGNSRARSRGDTNIAAGTRHVLSRLRTNIGETWCATVDVTEDSGATYTLTAGDCSAR